MTGHRHDLGDDSGGDLDGELRRLFDDKRLAVPPRAGAEDIVVAGARRIRRRRAALATAGGALAVVALAGGVLALGGLRTGPAQVALPPASQPVPSTSRPALLVPPIAPTAAPTSTTPGAQSGDQAPLPETQSPRSSPRQTAPSPPSTSTRLPVVSGSVLGPSGYGALQLGMSFEAAKATGMLADASAPPSGCATYLLAEGSSAVSGVYISPTAGILRFEAAGAATPENARIGSTLAQLRAAYPDLAKGSSTYTASAGSGGSYVFYLDDSDVVTAYELIGPAVTC
ncbi:MAG TPA: hypothetical protein VFG87_29980 [Amycolatopsis sp.]|nr:hypothetical protein [Amycolatopsis sp.]